MMTFPKKPKQFGWTDDRVQNTFKYLNPMKIEDENIRAATVEAFTDMRQVGGDFAKLMLSVCRSSPELTRAINSIQEAVMLANAAIAIHGFNVEQLEYRDAEKAAVNVLLKRGLELAGLGVFEFVQVTRDATLTVPDREASPLDSSWVKHARGELEGLGLHGVRFEYAEGSVSRIELIPFADES